MNGKYPTETPRIVGKNSGSDLNGPTTRDTQENEARNRKARHQRQAGCCPIESRWLSITFPRENTIARERYIKTEHGNEQEE